LFVGFQSQERFAGTEAIFQVPSRILISSLPFKEISLWEGLVERFRQRGRLPLGAAGSDRGGLQEMRPTGIFGNNKVWRLLVNDK